MNASALHLYVDGPYLSPYALSVFVALRHKQLAFEVTALDLDAAQQNAAAYAGLSLTQRVPTLVNGEFALSESSAITEYLDEQFSDRPLYPRGIEQRARARQLQAWLRSDLLALRADRSTEVALGGLEGGPLSAAGKVAAHKLVAGLQALLPGDSQYLFGEWSIVDIDVALMLYRLRFDTELVPPRLRDYAQRQWQHPAVQEWLQWVRRAA